MLTFLQGETVEVYSEVKDTDGNYIDPTTSITVTITDPDGTEKVSAASMTKSATGKYLYYYNLASDATDGWWKVLVIVTDTGSKVTKTSGGFKVGE